jgi:hypothetical protein
MALFNDVVGRRRTDVWHGVFYILLTAFLVTPTTVSADDHGVVFLFPTPGLTFYYLDTVNVQYTSSFPSPNLYIFCNGGYNFSKSLCRLKSSQELCLMGWTSYANDTPPPSAVSSTPAAPFNGSTLLLLNFTSSTPCFFDLRPGTDSGHGANSPNFTLVNNPRSQTTVGLPASATNTNTAGATSPTFTSPADETRSGLSTAAAVGIGIGSTLAVLLVAGVAIFFIWRRRKARNDAAAANTAGAGLGGGAVAMNAVPQYMGVPYQQDPKVYLDVTHQDYATSQHLSSGYTSPSELPADLRRAQELAS